MNRSVVWGANAALFVFLCWLAAGLINQVLAGVVLPGAAVAAQPPRPVPPPSRTWDERKIILDRNLFNASVLGGATEPVPVEEDLERTKLPLRLLGTAAHEDPRFSRAAVEDLDSREHRVLRVDEEIHSARVLRIERRRIVLDNRGHHEELTLSSESSSRPATARRGKDRRRAARRAPSRARSANADRVRRLAENRFAVKRDDVEKAVNNPADLFSQARILPKYESGEMVGVQLNGIKSGSVFEAIGIRNGDIIQELNGIRITNQQDSAQVLRELGEAREFDVVVLGSDGQEKTLTYELED